MKRIILLIIPLFFIAACSKKPAEMAPLVQFQPTMPVKTLWSTSVGEGNKKEYLKLTPTLYANRIYTTTSKGQISAVDTQTGRRVWGMNIKAPISTGVGADNAMLYVGTRDAEVIAFNRQNGSIVWRVPVSNEVLSKPNAVGNTVLVKTVDDHLYALNKQDGKVLWSYTQPAPGLTLRGGNSPEVANGLVVV